MSQWEKDKKWSDKFLTEIKGILGVHLIGEANKEEDQNHNTDLIILKMDTVRIGCRVRKNEYLKKYNNEFTIRSERPKGTKTELAKIIEGWGDYFFYGICNKEETELETWHLCCLKTFRLWFNYYLVKNKGVVPGIHQKNKDGSSCFIAFSFSQLPKEFIVANFIYNQEQAA